MPSEFGYRRVWYAEHHHIATIASSATSVLIAHVAAHTRDIRLGDTTAAAQERFRACARWSSLPSASRRSRRRDQEAEREAALEPLLNWSNDICQSPSPSSPVAGRVDPRTTTMSPGRLKLKNVMACSGLRLTHP